MIRRLFTRLISAEVRRLTAERNQARHQRADARRVAVRWHLYARLLERSLR
jgi:hypothetical protein